MKTKIIVASLCLSVLSACGNLDQIIKEIENTTNGTGVSMIPSEFEMASGLKEALEKGTNSGVNKLNVAGGFLNDPQVKIPFPKELVKVENTLRDIGLSSEVDRVVNSLNEAAEKAVIEAKPLFVNAIKEMTFQDVKNILIGSDSAATTYLNSKTRGDLVNAFQPKIKNSLDQVNATKYWTDIIGTYNKIPFVNKVNEDLPAYVTGKAIDGLFLQIAKEELAIRQNPIERTTSLLKKVFGYADSAASN
ncbi:MAG: DUF4197 domain-containing protein [Bacteroidetes bacterium]|nr:MAG: DUF4197 domain-containing protein [Bacteroidota bacterium]MBL1143673.1 DUF4197 domain-containing protein [Bacteroidota bacterium]MCB0801849.1 DUF4197 domain-containing protein [Flavobacteriales bacterium]NOG56475.1 DUF4197 domain-containing protein [Bacteroidota bacterium]